MNWNIILSISAAFSPILIVLLGGMGWLLRHERERREAVETQLSEKKYETYMAIINIFYDVIKATKKNTPVNQEEVSDKMLEASKNLFFYGSDEIISAYQNWTDASQNQKDNIRLFGDFVVLIRREMGNRKTKLTSNEFLRQVITDYDDAKAKGLLAPPVKAVK